MKNIFSKNYFKYFLEKDTNTKILKIVNGIKLVVLVYFALYAIRFIQLNFTGHECIKVNSLPHCLFIDIQDYFYDNDEKTVNKMTIAVQHVDLNGDFKKEFIVSYANLGVGYDEIFSIGENNTFTSVGFPRSWDMPVFYIPKWTIFGYPIIYEDGGAELYWLGDCYEDSKY